MAISPPKRIARLKQAYSPEFLEPQEHYVAYPVKSGPQACLIKETQPNGRVLLVDALTVVPDDVRHDAPNGNQVYSCMLGVIDNFYKAEIDRLILSKEFDALRIQGFAKQSEYRGPFRSARLHGLAQAAQRLVAAWLGGATTKPPSASQHIWDEYQASLAAADCWYTQHLRVGEASKTCVDQWRILGMWESWEKRNLPWRDRADEYRTKYPLRGNNGKIQGRTKLESLDADAFEKRCRHMGLKKGKPTKKKRRPPSRRRGVESARQLSYIRPKGD